MKNDGVAEEFGHCIICKKKIYPGSMIKITGSTETHFKCYKRWAKDALLND
jgi:hypothetical protein